MAISVSKGKRQAIDKMTSNLEKEFNKLQISNKIDFKLFREVLFTTRDKKVFLTLGLEEDIFNDTKILKTIYPFEKYNMKFINFGSIFNLISGFISMYNFLNDELNNTNYKFINEQSKINHLSIQAHSDKLFALTQELPITKTKVNQYTNFLYYHYKSIHGYFLQEKLLQNVYKNLKFDNNLLDTSQYLNKLTNNSDTKKLFEEITSLISSDYEAVLKNSSIQLRDNEILRKQLDNLILETR